MKKLPDLGDMQYFREFLEHLHTQSEDLLDRIKITEQDAEATKVKTEIEYDFQKLLIEEPVVRAAYHYHLSGDLGYELMLKMTIVELSKQKKILQEQLTNCLIRR